MKKQDEVGINFRNITLILIIIEFLIFVILSFSFGLENIRKYIMWITFPILLIILFFFIVMPKKIIKKIEPREENNLELLELKMNQGIAFFVLFITFGVALVIPGITEEYSRRVGLFLIAGLFFLFLGIVIFFIEYLPRLNKFIRLKWQ